LIGINNDTKKRGSYGQTPPLFKSLFFSAAPIIWEIEPDLFQKLVTGWEFL
jgi:hypothetical protein